MAKVWRCNLDNASVLTGIEQIDDTTVAPGDVVFDHEPDIQVGRYRWNGEAFDPVGLGRSWAVPDGPDAWHAVFRALDDIQQQTGVVYSEPVATWIRYYQRSFGRDSDPNVIQNAVDVKDAAVQSGKVDANTGAVIRNAVVKGAGR